MAVSLWLSGLLLEDYIELHDGVAVYDLDEVAVVVVYVDLF